MEQLVKTEKVVTNFYTYEGVVKALNGVSVEVRKGETYGLVGESGCGKSVTVRSIMRIVQSPGRIEDGKILLFFSDTDRNQAVDILKRSEAFMQTIRGNEISMIFQEASTSLNPVLSIEYQIGESFRLHRMPEILRETIDELQANLDKKKIPFVSGWKKFQISLFNRQKETLENYERLIDSIEFQLAELEDDGTSKNRRLKDELNRKRDMLRKDDRLVMFFRRFPFLRRYYRRINPVIHRKVVNLLKELGVPNPENIARSYPHELSGGMQQRIVIAIALACHPRILIADEPTSNLDVTIQAQILDMIRVLKETTISSVLFITHDLGVVAEICDRVTVMYAGDTCETAEVKELFQKPLHPYTKALLRSVPKVRQEEALATIPGVVPNLVNPPTGCRFHPRCESAMDICKREKPPLFTYAPGHTVSCHLYTSKEAKS
ncbi:MAG: ABC transporter ATP-binding protein [Spirochaetales bacterium]|nr:ABC transporter ATP-binding protein [Spirochaetales bacterium]